MCNLLPLDLPNLAAVHLCCFFLHVVMGHLQVGPDPSSFSKGVDFGFERERRFLSKRNVRMDEAEFHPWLWTHRCG